ncbi:phage tail tape measure protein [Novosphingobium sp. SG720]|uniref:phage tail tape measure protein n=1 Tax=Novosphingobium sp. SG720 TaxID=2586998 RepID=UPI0014455EC6|nr:TP901 family phage tail tape measure protein [Novosphingobium sp. SG720]
MANNRLSLIVSFMGQDKLSGALKNLIGLGKSGDQALKGMTREAGRLRGAMKDVEREIANASGNVTPLINRQRELSDELERVNGQIERQRRLNAAGAQANAMRAQGEAYKGAGVSSIIGGVAMAAPLVVATKQAMDFESAMADVRKVVDFPTPQAFDRMGRDVLNLSTRIPMASEGIAAIVAAAGRANIPRQELLRFAEDAAKMGVAFDMTGDDAGAMMAKWRTAFNLSQSGVVALSNQINALTNAYGGNAGAVSNIVTRIGSLGKVAGVSTSQLAAMGQLLNSVGVEEEIAATGIKNMMLAMSAGASATKSQKSAFASLGLDASKVSQRMQTDSAGAINDVLARVAKMPKAAQAGILTSLFGSESVGAIAPMLTNLEKLKANLNLVGDSAQYAGSMNKEYLARIATTEGATGLAANALKALNIEMGKHLLPALTEGSGSLVGMANSLRDFAAAHPELVSFMIKAAVGLTAMRVGFGVVQYAAGTVLGPLAKGWEIYSKFKEAGSIAAAFPRVASAFGMLRNAAIFLGQGFMRAGAMMLANPMILLIVAIGVAIGVVAYLVYTNWDKIKAAFSAGWQWVKDTMSGAGEWLKNIGGMMMQGLLAMIDPFGLRNRLLEVARNGIKAFKDFFGIKSPSRLMMQMGGHLTAGLGHGIDGGARHPLRAMGKMAAGVASAGALSLAGPSLAAPSAGPGFAPRSAQTLGGGVKIDQIVIHQQPGENTDMLVDRLIREIERRSGGGGHGGSFGDDF